MTQDARPTLFEPDPVLAGAIEEAVVIAPPVVEDVEPPVAVEEPARRRANPWVVVLWVASVVLIAIALWLVVSTYSEQFSFAAMSSYQSQESYRQYALRAALGSLAPGMFAVGLGSAVAATSIHALQWMRRHP